MEKFITSIKKKYRERLLVRERQWPLRHSSKIISLLLVNRKIGEGYYGNQQRGKAVEETKRSLLDYSKLFEAEDGQKPVRKVLVEGDAGIGKTSFCLSVIEDWANGKIFCEFKLVLFLPLRHRIVSSAGSLLELLKLLHPSKEVCKSVFLEMEEGVKVLIVADGWDELDKSGRQEGSFLYTLLFEDLPFASVILTSRPSASSSLHQLTCIDRCVEIHGFSKVRSLDYILSEFADDRDKAIRLLKQISVTPFLGSICSVPLNCAILCHLWRTREEALPTTMTDLHTKVILNIILHNLQKNEAYKSIKGLADFDALPNDLIESWKLLCELAYCAMEEDQIVFSRKELATIFPQGLALDDKVLCFGLLQSAEPILETGWGVSFHFLHQVFQEYLAALHIVKQPYNKQLEIIELKPDEAHSDMETLLMIMKQMSRRSFRFSLVWRFFCGIYFHEAMVDLKVQRPNVEYLIDSLITMIKNTLLILFEGWLQLCHLAFEARNELISQKVIQAIYGCFQEFTRLERDEALKSAVAALNKPFHPYDSARALSNLFQITAPTPMVLGRPLLSAYDCAAIVFVISRIQENNIPLRLDFSWSGIGDDSIRALTDALVSKNGALKIQVLNLNGNKLADKVIGDLFSRASAAFDSLQVLEVSDNKIGTETLMSIAAPKEKLSFKLLSTLDLSNNRLSVSGIRALHKAAKCDTFCHLHRLNLEGSLSTNDSSINDDLLNSFASCCCGLLEVNVSYNILGIPGAVALGRIVFSSNFSIPLLYPSLMKEAMGHKFCRIAPQFTITLNETNLGDSGLIAFIKELPGQTCFYTLDLKGNCIHNTGILCLIRAMHSKTIILANELYEFNFGNNPFGTCGTRTIGEMLSNSCYEFTGLNLSQCQLTNVEVVPPSGESVIGVREVGQLLCRLPQTDILFDLTLDGNNFTGEGIYVLAGFMHLCPFLSWLSCINCRITSEDLLLLFDVVFGKNSPDNRFPCRELAGWRLDHNKIDDKGFSALMERLPSQFPKLGYGRVFNKIFVFDGNPVNPKLAGAMNDEMERRHQEDLAASRSSTVNQKMQQPQVENADHQSSSTNTVHVTTAGDKSEPSPSDFTPQSQSADDILVPSTPHSMADLAQIKIYIPQAEVGPPDCVIKAPPRENASETSRPIASTLSSADKNDSITKTPSHDHENVEPNTPSSADSKDCITKIPPHENASECSRPSTLSSTNTKDKVEEASRLLTIDNLAAVQREVWEARSKWYNIGLELGLTAGTLDAIEQSNHHVDNCFRATLMEWLRNSKLKPTLSSLADALKSPTVGQTQLAEDIIRHISMTLQP